MHKHKMITERGPFGCNGGGVSFTQVCSCGAERERCTCDQCRDQGTNEGQWKMPICAACKLRHPADQSCK